MHGCVYVCLTGILFCMTNYASSQGISNLRDRNLCIGKQRCGDCIAAGKDCAWCSDPSYAEDNIDRCGLLRDHTGCPPEYLISSNSVLNRTSDKEPVDGTSTDSPIQLQPQVISLNIRPNDPQNFTLTFRLAKNYPVDLYFLMDLSSSMKDKKEDLANFAVSIANEMKNITTDFRMGFGSFVDKPVMPNIGIEGNSTCGENCTSLFSRNNGNNDDVLEPTYSFKNHLQLTNDSNLFQETVRKANMSDDLDGPNGGLDAVMQAIVCETQIGWRTASRRMVFYSSDSGFHTAGDGKLGGIIKPNDGECHLDNDMYSEGTTQDYPSVSQTASKIKDKNVNLIFAVTENTVKDFSRLEQIIPGSSTGILADDSSNIVALVRDNYEKITSKIQMISNNKDSNVKIRHFTNCTEKDQELKESNECTGLKVGDSVSFEVEITVTHCPSDSSDSSQAFFIQPFGLSDNVEVRMEIICECDCENNTLIEHSPHCNGNGSYVCGDCNCDPKYYGKTCNCLFGDDTAQEQQQDCIAPNSTNPCSGHGDCVCGACECNQRSSDSTEKYSGRWCQCDHYSCPFYNGALCGGVSHGVCNCGKCECLPEFTGENCGCSTRNDSCITSNGTLCGGPERGECVCNSCVCKPESNYQGRTCEDCKDCSIVCLHHKACVQCVAYGTGELKDTCEQCRKEGYISVQNVLPEGMNSCEFKDQDGCLFQFAYHYGANGNIKIIAKQEKECPPEESIIYIILGIVAGLVVGLGGVAFLLIRQKRINDKDRRELANFMNEVNDTKWGTNENPIYVSPRTDYDNPMYTGAVSGEDAAGAVLGEYHTGAVFGEDHIGAVFGEHHTGALSRKDKTGAASVEDDTVEVTVSEKDDTVTKSTVSYRTQM